MRDMSLDWEKIEHIYSHPTSPKSMRKGGRVAEAALGKMKISIMRVTISVILDQQAIVCYWKNLFRLET